MKTFVQINPADNQTPAEVKAALSPLKPYTNTNNEILIEVPVWEKSTLTLDEAAAYSGIGKNKLRTLTDKEDCNFVLWIGSKRLIKREMLDEYIREAFSI